jgi:acetylornithine deacetylase/succinyl-diaminopimelate desuccinylase-like protein
MKLPLLFAVCCTLGAATPDWQSIDPYATTLLQRYIRIDTSSPPADTTKTAALLKQELESHGFTVQVLDAGNGHLNILTRLAGRDRAKKPLLLLNHMDVVPVDRKAWSIDPFGAELKDGWIWGRGALDMKSTGIIQLVALMALKDAGIVPPRDIVFLASADEEAGGTWGVRWILRHHPEALDVEYALDEGGFLSRDVFAPGKLVAGISVGEKQPSWVRIRAKGTAAHGSQPIPDNANDILLRAIARAMELPPDVKPNAIVEGMRHDFGSFAENKFTRAIQKNTMSLTTLRSGVGDPPKPNVIPSAAEATIDCRLLPGVNAQEFVSEIRARINDPRVTVELISEPVDTAPSDPNTPVFAALRSAILKNYPAEAVTPILVPYSTDSSALRARGVKAYGFMPMVLDGAALATFHSDEERVQVSEFLRGIRLFYDFLASAW